MVVRECCGGAALGGEGGVNCREGEGWAARVAGSRLWGCRAYQPEGRYAREPMTFLT